MGHFSGKEHNRFVDFGAGIDSPDHVMVRAELKAMWRDGTMPPISEDSRGCLLPSYLLDIDWDGWPQARPRELRGRPVRWRPRWGEEEQDVVFQLVELRALLWAPARRHSNRLHPGPCQLGSRRHNPHPGNGGVANNLRGRKAVVPVQGAVWEPSNANASGFRGGFRQEKSSLPFGSFGVIRDPQAGEDQGEVLVPHWEAQVSQAVNVLWFIFSILSSFL